MTQISDLNLTVSLNSEAHKTAFKFACQQDSVGKGKQVYLNTLAMYAVQKFLGWMNIKTDLREGDSWHPVVRCFQDIADLMIPRLGKLECRPVLVGDTCLVIPREVSEDRIGYIAVQFEDQEQLITAKLIGFLPTRNLAEQVDRVMLTSLHSLEYMIDYIYDLEMQSNVIPDAKVSPIELGKWLQHDFSGAIKDSWQDLITVLGVEQREIFPIFAFTYRPVVAMGKLIDLSTSTLEGKFVFVIGIHLYKDNRREVMLRLFPQIGQFHLPSKLHFELTDSSGKSVFNTIVPEKSEGHILNFHEEVGEYFQVQFTMQDRKIVESFII